MRVNIVKENNKYYLEIERPHYNNGHSPSKEAQKVYTLIKRNIEEYKDEDEPFNVQYANVSAMLSYVKIYFTTHPNDVIIRIPYQRTYPSKNIKVVEKDGTGKKYYWWAYTFKEKFISDYVEVVKVK